MGKIWMPGGGGGADLEMVTAERPDVLTGKVIVDKDGNPLAGTMPDNGAVNQSLGINSTYTIPKGYHNGLGKVIQNVASMAGQTINPTASQQTVSSSGKYMTGNVVVNGVSNLTAANIRKGVNVGGVVGSFQGYVPTASDLYLRGNSYTSWLYIQQDKFHFESGMIYAYGSGGSPAIGASINLTGYNYLNVELMCTLSDRIYLSIQQSDLYSSSIVATSPTLSANTTTTVSLNISALSAVRIFSIGIVNYRTYYIYRIWLS
ncbi:hypothetical protein RZO55_20240 [Clostridium boliviensis]|uniref:Tail fiber protein n=1 Tax=Clostridium boliviensis TaxID=318465 RepID=A0ABU4GSD5_9CLOT|nr:hypothetical protein [Clostridium boliviensis]MDW2799905.1 hypothetical protein [Clostridium boliviensis]